MKTDLISIETNYYQVENPKESRKTIVDFLKEQVGMNYTGNPAYWQS